MGDRQAPSSSLNAGTLMAIPDNIVGGMQKSFEFIMEWNRVKPPSRFVLGSATMRKLSNRVRQQPVKYVVIVHQSLKTAEDGEVLCQRGVKAIEVLLSEQHSTSNKEFVEGTVEDIRKYAEILMKSTKDFRSKFRLLRVTILEIHKDLKNVIEKQRDRPEFFTLLGRYFSKDVKACEKQLGAILDDINHIEESLNDMIHWWQKVGTQATYLHTSGQSPLTAKRNVVILADLHDGFTKLKEYFDDYNQKVSSVYDVNYKCLSQADQDYIEKTQNYAGFSHGKK